MEFTIDYLSDITYKCELTLDIKDVKGLIRANNLRRTLCSVSYALIKGANTMVNIDDFKKLELKVAEIKEVQDHHHADKLYIINVDLGDKTKQIVAGIRAFYKKEDLVGKQVVVVDNLEPVVLRGVESQGMLLAAADETGITIISPERKVKLGSIVR